MTCERSRHIWPMAAPRHAGGAANPLWFAMAVLRQSSPPTTGFIAMGPAAPTKPLHCMRTRSSALPDPASSVSSQILAKLPPFAGRLSLHHDRTCARVGDVFGTEPCRMLCEDAANLIEATRPYDHPERASHATWGRGRACNAVRVDKNRKSRSSPCGKSEPVQRNQWPRKARQRSSWTAAKSQSPCPQRRPLQLRTLARLRPCGSRGQARLR
jgi:hypothetical protein